ncbi:MAG: dihydrofolate reductase [Candidatus Paceibacterota bacterium]
MKKHPRISAIAAVGERTRVIGKDNQLLWHIPEDLKRFKEITRGHPVIMGRKTFESILSILGKPLPGRTNIVVTRRNDYDTQGAQIADSIEGALEQASVLDSDEIFVIGGQQIYEQALPFINRLYLTLVDSSKEGDTWFPKYEQEFSREAHREEHSTEDGLRYAWVTLDRG